MIAKVRRVENKQKGNLERERNYWQDRNQSKENLDPSLTQRWSF